MVMQLSLFEIDCQYGNKESNRLSMYMRNDFQLFFFDGFGEKIRVVVWDEKRVGLEGCYLLRDCV